MLIHTFSDLTLPLLPPTVQITATLKHASCTPYHSYQESFHPRASDPPLVAAVARYEVTGQRPPTPPPWPRPGCHGRTSWKSSCHFLANKRQVANKPDLTYLAKHSLPNQTPYKRNPTKSRTYSPCVMSECPSKAYPEISSVGQRGRRTTWRGRWPCHMARVGVGQLTALIDRQD